jgi:hypothetical protein
MAEHESTQRNVEQRSRDITFLTHTMANLVLSVIASMEREIRMTDVPDANPDVTDLGRAVENIVQTILTSQIDRIQVMLIECNAANEKENLHKVSSPPNPSDSGLETTSFPTPIKLMKIFF